MAGGGVIQAINQQRWERAQIAEAEVAQYDIAGARRTTETIFRYLGIATDQGGKSIAEIGCGPYPCVSFCSNAMPILYDPLRFEPLAELARAGNAVWFEQPYEDATAPRVSETWLFNCLQHVRDPELVVSKAKESSIVVRFFEPIGERITEYHPHAFIMDDFVRWFGSAELYEGGAVDGFHTADCAYGTWVK